MFLSVYIAEAHASDQWPMGNHVNIKQHKTLQDRLKAAWDYNTMLSEKGLTCGELVVDDINNLFMNTFACHPERFFIILNKKLVWKPQPIKAMYDIPRLRSELQKYIK